MKYHIYYRPVFNQKGSLRGYDMLTMAHDEEKDGYDRITVDGASPGEYLRLRTMIKGMDPFSDQVYFVDRHPLRILDYLRGKKEQPKRDPDWENSVPEWKVNMRGERI